MGQPHESGTYELGDIINHKKTIRGRNPPVAWGNPQSPISKLMMLVIMWLRQCHKTPKNENGKLIPPIYLWWLGVGKHCIVLTTIHMGKLSYFTSLNLAAIKGDDFPYHYSQGGERPTRSSQAAAKLYYTRSAVARTKSSLSPWSTRCAIERCPRTALAWQMVVFVVKKGELVFNMSFQQVKNGDLMINED